MIRLRLLGDVAISIDGSPKHVALLREPVRFSVLAYVAASTRAYACREELQRLLWPDSPRSRAQTALRQALHRIRSQLGQDVLVSRGTWLEVNRSELEVDVMRFRESLAAHDRKEALALYRGDLLEGYPSLHRQEFDDWIEASRTGLKRSAAVAAIELAVECERASAYHDAAHWWRIAFGLSPFDEVNLRGWMRALALEGACGRALQAYERAAQRLRSDLGVEPSRATRQLADAIRQGGKVDRTDTSLSA